MVLALDVDFYYNLSAVAVAQAIERLQNSIKARHPEFKRIFIEAKSISRVARKELI